MTTKIEWADITINPVVGCTKCSPGCANCYAERFAARLAKNPKTAAKYAGVVDENGKWTGETRFDNKALRVPSTKRGFFANQPGSRAKRIFVGSMCDLFHPTVSDSSLNAIFYEIAQNPEHTFIFLTKRASQMKIRMNCFASIAGDRLWPLPNLWLGVTVCNQDEADAKIPVLLQTPAAKRLVSIEPMLGPINLGFTRAPTDRDYRGWNGDGPIDYVETTRVDGLHWVICGGETGPGARPMHPNWVRGLRAQCEAVRVPFFFKGWGEWGTNWSDMCTGLPAWKMFQNFGHYCNKAPTWMHRGDKLICPDGHVPSHGGEEGKSFPMCIVSRIGKRRSGRLLDGVEHNAFPEMRDEQTR